MLKTENSSQVVARLENVILVRILAKVLYALSPALSTQTLILNSIPDHGGSPHTDHVRTNPKVFQELEARLE